MEKELTVKLPEPDVEGRYKFGDGSEVTLNKQKGLWMACKCDRTPIRASLGVIRYFLCPQDAANELGRRGEARDVPSVPWKEIHHTLRVEGGEPIEVYVNHYEADTRLAELNFVTASIRFAINGVQPEELRNLARLLRDFASILKEEGE